MNFLAHAWLAAQADADAGERAALIVGGVVGDWIKGPLERVALPFDLRQGVALHRAIDRFADTQTAFMRSRARISPLRRRWSGVLIDMYYDHLLAAEWPAWHASSWRPVLPEFTTSVYEEIAARLGDLPANCRPALDLMRQEDWLGSYGDAASLAAILERMSRRTRQPNPLAAGADELLAARADFAIDCGEFLAAARDFVSRWLPNAEPAPTNR
jgi:acyl carrier protein phosphodiesterase